MSLEKIWAGITLRRLGVAMTLLYSLSCTVGAELSPFVWRNPLPQGDGLNCVAYGDGKYVAVGGFGMILTSSNASNWSVRALPAKSYLASVAYGNGAFVVNSPSEILASTNSGVDWTELAPPVTNEFISVKFVNDRFLLGTWRGPLLSSTNGSDWERIPLSRELEFISAQAFAFGNSLYVAVGSSGVMTSADGREWVPPEISISQPFRGWASTVTFGDGQFIATGYDGEIYGSWDGQYWEPRLEQPMRTYALMTVVYTNGCFVTAGFGVLRKSTDGYDWTNPAIDPDAGMHINSLVFANGKWVGVGKSGVAGYGGEIWVSTNLQEWLPQIHGARADLFDSAVGNGVQAYRLWREVLITTRRKVGFFAAGSCAHPMDKTGSPKNCQTCLT